MKKLIFPTLLSSLLCLVFFSCETPLMDDLAAENQEVELRDVTRNVEPYSFAGHLPGGWKWWKPL